MIFNKYYWVYRTLRTWEPRMCVLWQTRIWPSFRWWRLSLRPSTNRALTTRCLMMSEWNPLMKGNPLTLVIAKGTWYITHTGNLAKGNMAHCKQGCYLLSQLQNGLFYFTAFKCLCVVSYINKKDKSTI